MPDELGNTTVGGSVVTGRAADGRAGRPTVLEISQPNSGFARSLAT